MSKEIDYCCTDLKEEMIDRNPVIVIHDNKFYVEYEEEYVLQILCCPWCGKRLEDCLK